MRSLSNKFFLFFLFVQSLFSCKKDPVIILEGNISDPSRVTDYYPLRVGNYWIYKQFTIDDRIDTNIIVSSYAYEDSLFVEKDTLINGIQFSKFVSISENYRCNYFLRDSLDYIVSNKGTKLFSSTDFIDTLHSSYSGDWIYSFCKMANKDTLVNTSLGQYPCYDILTTLVFMGTHIVSPQYEHEFYAKGIGNILRVDYFTALYPKVRREYRLLRYHINN